MADLTHAFYQWGESIRSDLEGGVKKKSILVKGKRLLTFTIGNEHKLFVKITEIHQMKGYQLQVTLTDKSQNPVGYFDKALPRVLEQFLENKALLDEMKGRIIRWTQETLPK